MIVIDNSVVVPMFVEHLHSDEIGLLRNLDEEWLLPPLWRYEFTNVLARMTRTGKIEISEALFAIDEARVELGGREFPVDQQLALRIACKYELSGYDAQYVALAIEYGTVCVTHDSGILKRVPEVAISISRYIKRQPPI